MWEITNDVLANCWHAVRGGCEMRNETQHVQRLAWHFLMLCY